VSIFERTMINQLLTFYDSTTEKPGNDNQLNLFIDYSGH